MNSASTKTAATKTAAVIGAGTIGLSWTALLAAHGWHVRITDPRPDLAEAVHHALAQAAPALAAQGWDTTGLAELVTVADSPAEAVAGAALVQENGPENLGWKRELFAELERFAPADAVLASSSSSIPASAIAGGAAEVVDGGTGGIDGGAGGIDGGRILVGHPFNPPHLIPVVEVVPGARTAPATVDRAVAIYRSLDRTPVVLGREVGGFVGNRLQTALLREAIHLVQEGIATPAGIDELMRGSLGPRWAALGPFQAAHLGGGPGGFAHLIAHIWPAMSRLRIGDVDPERMAAVVDAVTTEYGARPYDTATAEAERRQLAVFDTLT
ncbi:3-hydroxyacyl-CoA dehydrogenase NAD-binding domain-containing protein [Kitasatospora sp. NPDC093806]|uniref:3-hydroxyacyl-CoA dehydrogenase NAD-binding domain-containing protein n=1 Tax=Kitasatospora sp. NPDC093806 TaxID=3155075 RepID=UPI00342A4DFD